MAYLAGAGIHLVSRFCLPAIQVSSPQIWLFAGQVGLSLLLQPSTSNVIFKSTRWELEVFLDLYISCMPLSLSINTRLSLKLVF